MAILLSLALALILGLGMTRILKPLSLPDVTAYLITGILLGPYCLGLLGIEGLGFSSMEAVHNLSLLADVALGFIAFSIGNEFRLHELKQIGKQATIVGIGQALVTALLVDGALYGLHLILGPEKLPLPVVLTLGAIATATAPAATLMVVRQYKAKGKVTDILLPVVALDDAVGLVVFAVSFGIARAIQNGTFSLISIVVNPLVEIVVSLVLGAIMGAILTWIERFFNSNSNRLSLTIAFVVLTVALSKVGFSFGEVHVGFSPLLVCMMLGTIFCNICPLSEDLMERSDKWTAPLFVAFFVLSGAELELKVFTDVIIVGIGVAYILFRSLGKYLGAFVSTKVSKCDPMIQKYLGITLLPQAGVALGMSVTAMQLGAAEGALIRNITLFAVMIYELVGPALTKWALTKSGDIQPKGEEVLTRRQRKLAAAEAKRKELES